MSKKLILASTSPRRKELLSSTGLEYEAIASEYEEDMTLPMEPADLAKYLSRGKAEAVAAIHKNAVIIGADTFVVYHGGILGKPHTPERAKEMLRELSGTVHSVITGFTVIDSDTSSSVSEAIEAKIYFKNLTEKEIDDYIATGETLDKAGAYAIQGLGKSLVEKTEGDYNTIVGLPLDRLLEVLKDFGVPGAEQGGDVV
jgi:septum formation protein